jgi:hypothetical protein
MKLNIPFWKRIHQFFCKHETVGWSSTPKGINSKEGCEYVTYECCKCGLSIGEWFEEGAWEQLDFPDKYTIQNKRKVSNS